MDTGRQIKVAKLEFGGITTLYFPDQKIILDVITNEEAVRHAGIVVDELSSGTYDKYDVKGRVVIDIGAFYGETAIWFLKRGAKAVYCIEPYASFFLIGKNILMNGFTLEDVHTYNAPLLSEHRTVSYRPDLVNSGATAWVEDKQGKSCESMTLEDAIKIALSENKEAADSLVLKMDCEGEEHDVFKTLKDSDLRQFKYILIEVHGDSYDDIKERLEKTGYMIDDIHKEFDNAYMIYAQRTN
jgi:FkbM family methyltransferase